MGVRGQKSLLANTCPSGTRGPAHGVKSSSFSHKLIQRWSDMYAEYRIEEVDGDSPKKLWCDTNHVEWRSRRRFGSLHFLYLISTLRTDTQVPTLL